MATDKMSGGLPPPPPGVDMTKFAAYKQSVMGPGNIPEGVDMAKFAAYKASKKAEGKPGFFGGLKAGLTAQPGEGVGHFIGAAAPAAIGAAIGSVIPGAGTAVGAALGETARQTMGAIVNPEEAAKQSKLGLFAKVAGAGAMQKGGEVAGKAIVGKLGEIIPTLTKKMQEPMAQMLKAFEGIEERLGMKVLKDPDILVRAKPMSEARQMMKEFWDKTGYEYGRKAIKLATGKRRLSESGVDDLMTDVLDQVENVAEGYGRQGTQVPRELVQKALAATYSTKDAIGKAMRAGAKEDAQYFISARNQIYDFLENQLPGFSALRKDYEEAIIKNAFSSFLPTNKNGTTSVLRTLAGMGSAILNPVKGVPAVLASSPYIGGKIIQGAAMTGPARKLAGEAAVAASKLAGPVSVPIIEELTSAEPEKKPKFKKKDRGIYEEIKE